MAEIKIQQILKKMQESKSCENLAYGAALQRFNSTKLELVEDFNEHPVTKEIEAGPDAPNYTNSLSEGNLFSFIGFTKGENPLSKLRKLIYDIKLNKYVRDKIKVGKKINYVFQISMPPEEEIINATPMPDRWSSGSWAKKIENSISGLQYYLFGYGEKFKNSFSGTGIQIKNKLRPDTFKGVKYLSGIFARFRGNLKR